MIQRKMQCKLNIRESVHCFMLKITPSTVVCSKHSKKGDFEWTPVNKTLQKDTVPSVFDWPEQNTPRRQISRKVLSKPNDEMT